MIENLVDSLVWDVQHPVIRHIFFNEIDMLLYRSSAFSESEIFIDAVLRELTMYAASLFDNLEYLSEANRLLQQAGAFLREQLSGKSREAELNREEYRHRVNITK